MPDDAKPLPKGNPLRRRGGVVAGVSGLLVFLLMAHDAQLSWGVPVGALLCAACTWGVLDLCGSFDDPAERVATATSIAALYRPVAQTLASLLLCALMLRGATAGVNVASRGSSQAVWGLLVTASFLLLVAAVFDLGDKLGPWAKDERGEPRPLFRRHGFWVVAAASLLYLPRLGACSFWDPWETHYGEVAREILSRDDWISLWWVQQGWFFSKPILVFWIQSIAMAALGVHYRPDTVLIGADGTASAHPEWAMRMPVFLMTVIAMYLLYKGVAKVFGRRAGLLGGLVLATTTDWLFIGHQTMADMPFVAAMSAAMGLLLLGLHSSEDRLLKLYEVSFGRRALRLSGWHLVFGAVLITAIPQLVYFLSRNVELVLHGSGGPHGFRLHWDEFRSGSPGNCGLPGSENCALQSPASIPASLRGEISGMGPTLWRAVGAFEPFVQGIVWAVVIGVVLRINWGERRLQRIYYLGAWYFAAVATMAKGPAGFGLPALCVFAYLMTAKRYRELLRLEILTGLLIILGVAIPWYVAMYVRHGTPFTDELIFHDMVNRAFGHVHDTNEGDDTGFRYYVWQLGYALFPWTGLAPLGLVYFLRRADTAGKGRGDASVVLVMWFLLAFALFAFMGTKFHHYIFPAVPPVAMLVGVLLDDALRRRRATLGPAPAGPTDPRAHAEIMLSGAAFAGALLLTLVGRDLVYKPDGTEPPGAIRLLQLFTYNYRRVWPDTLNFTVPLVVFAVAAVLLNAAFCVRALRRAAIVGLLVLGFAWSVFALDVYMVKTSPHWGQHELIEAYYRDRKGPDEMLVAYQMNWKGENFYTGNHAPVFVSTGDPFKQWLKRQRDSGVRVMYFVTEPGRTSGLRNEVQPKAYREVTDPALCNKFVVVRTEL